MKQRTLARWGLAGLLVLAGCAGQQELLPGSRSQGSNEAPAYFSQATDLGYRYAHNWIDRPCFTVDLPGHNWVLQSATPDYVMWHRGDHTLKMYLTDNRVATFAVAGMDAEAAIRAFIGFELDYIKPKFDQQQSPAPRIGSHVNGLYALWQWEGRGGRRAGVGRAQPADQRHTIVSLWLDPFVLSMDWATANLSKAEAPIEVDEVLDSLVFYPECFSAMRSGETWVQPSDSDVMAPPERFPLEESTPLVPPSPAGSLTPNVPPDSSSSRY